MNMNPRWPVYVVKDLGIACFKMFLFFNFLNVKSIWMKLVLFLNVLVMFSEVTSNKQNLETFSLLHF